MENTGYIELAYIPLILDEQSRVRSPPQFRTEGRFKAFKESLTFDFRPERGFTAINVHIVAIIGFRIKPEEVSFVSPMIVPLAEECFQVKEFAVPVKARAIKFKPFQRT